MLGSRPHWLELSGDSPFYCLLPNDYQLRFRHLEEDPTPSRWGRSLHGFPRTVGFTSLPPARGHTWEMSVRRAESHLSGGPVPLPSLTACTAEPHGNLPDVCLELLPSLR